MGEPATGVDAHNVPPLSIDVADEVRYLAHASQDDEGNARCFLRLHPDVVFHSTKEGWFFYVGTHWSTLGGEAEARVNALILDVLGLRRQACADVGVAVGPRLRGSADALNGCRAILKALRSVSMDDFDCQDHCLNVRNGYLNLQTKGLVPHSPAHMVTYCVPAEYRPDASPKVWLDFLRGCFDEPEVLIPYLQQVFGYCMTGEIREECCWYFFGEGRSGKGTVCQTILKLLGKPFGSQMAFSSLTADRAGDTQNFDFAGLKATRFLSVSESLKHEKLNAGKLKELTGGDPMRCAHKGKPHFEYVPRFKIVMQSNYAPNIDWDDTAAWRRLFVIEFPHSHIGDENKFLKDALLRPDVLEGVLAWVVDGAFAWYAAPNGLVHPDVVTGATGKYRQEVDVIGTWLEERCDVVSEDERKDCLKTPIIAEEYSWAWRGRGFRSGASTLHKDYLAWCKDRADKYPMQPKSFGMALRKKGFIPGDKVERLDGNAPQRVWYGLRLNTEVTFGG